MTQTISTPPTSAHLAAQYVQQQLGSIKPRIGIVLSSGLGSLVDSLDNVVTIPYSQLPGFPQLTVAGHGGVLVAGNYQGVGVICLQGRAHTYEGTDYQAVKNYIRTLKLLGCEYFLATNVSGSLREDVGPGELMLITDHINMQPGNPLVGLNEDEFGPRFFPLDNAYDFKTREELLRLADKLTIRLHQGVYISVLGPNYETAAEIRAFRILGADAIGMSTVPEVLVANHCGMKVAVLAIITNHATGLAKTPHSHDEVVRKATLASEKLNRLALEFIATLKTS